LPAAGERGNFNGSPFNRGVYGTYWSSTEINTGSRVLDFSSSVVEPAGGANRLIGFSLRCIAE
jgi:hypothetical protein